MARKRLRVVKSSFGKGYTITCGGKGIAKASTKQAARNKMEKLSQRNRTRGGCGKRQ